MSKDFPCVEVNQPPLTVLLPVYIGNTCSELEASLESIWTRQHLKPDQIVLVMDGKVNDDVEESIKKWQSSLPNIMTLVRIEKNMGLGYALNTGLQFCRNEYVARMDADDRALPERFELQMRHMLSKPELAIVGGQVKGMDDFFNELIYKTTLPTNNEEIISFSKWRCPLNHPTVMFRKSVVLKLGGYPKEVPEDYLLWVKMIQNGYHIENLDVVLVEMRSGSLLKKRRGDAFLRMELQAQKEFLKQGFITYPEYLRNCLCRIILRKSSPMIKKTMYRLFK